MPEKKVAAAFFHILLLRVNIKQTLRGCRVSQDGYVQNKIKQLLKNSFLLRQSNFDLPRILITILTKLMLSFTSIVEKSFV